MDSKVKEAVVKAVEKMRDDMIDTLQQLVRIPSVVGNEGEAQRFMEKQFERLGLDVHKFEADRRRVQSHVAFVDSNLPYRGRPNVVGILKGESQKRSIILNGHTDVVSPEPVDQWKHDPWGAEVEGDILYGRGALDMKAGLVANLYAMKALTRIGKKPEGTLILQSVIEEEAGGGGGTLACLVEGYTGDGMIISEPHPVLCISHAGILYFRIKVKGKTSHAGKAHLGVNAIGKMMKIYQSLVELDESRAASVSFPLFEKGSGRSCHLNIGTMKAGDWPSTVAGFAEMECRISFVPGETREDIQRIVESTIREVAEDDPWLREHPPLVEWFGWRADPWYQDPSDPFVRMAISSVESVMGRKMEVVGSAAGLDTRFSQYFGFPAVSFGPGGENTHGIDECVDLETFETATKVIALATLEWCSQNREPEGSG
ncbi:MAG: ArgE/DapE family deacylase [Proteobacteria bacterium]|nr:ArgE/DapE family deacylase [Pseudomonadota bacterium]